MFICEVPYDGSCFFDVGEYYIRKYNDIVMAKIKKCYLINPNIIWEKRCVKAGVDSNSLAGKKLKPNDVTYKLWEYHNAN